MMPLNARVCNTLQLGHATMFDVLYNISVFDSTKVLCPLLDEIEILIF